MAKTKLFTEDMHKAIFLFPDKMPIRTLGKIPITEPVKTSKLIIRKTRN